MEIRVKAEQTDTRRGPVELRLRQVELRLRQVDRQRRVDVGKKTSTAARPLMTRPGIEPAARLDLGEVIFTMHRRGPPPRVGSRLYPVSVELTPKFIPYIAEKRRGKKLSNSMDPEQSGKRRQKTAGKISHDSPRNRTESPASCQGITFSQPFTESRCEPSATSRCMYCI
jgi:hypothetical protein